MLSCYKKVEVSNLLINSEFNFNSRNKFISMSKNGDNFSLREINNFRQLSDLEEIKSIYDLNYNFCDTLNIKKSDDINWAILLGRRRCKLFTKNLIEEINFSTNFITTYHTQTLPLRKSLYENLSQILDPEGKEIEVPTYNHKSVSGRTSITSGFNFLTSSKEFRSRCSSKKRDNILVSIDFKACEPNLYLRSIGKSIDSPDVYSYLMEELSIKIGDREKLKRGILSVLYGASDSTASRILGGNKETLDQIKKFFMISENTQKLNNFFENNKCIFNAYGRPIFSDKSILNKWIQSSAVDFCSMAFLTFAQERNLSVAYLVHDEMVVDCSKQDFENFKDTRELFDPVTKISMPIEITVLGS